MALPNETVSLTSDQLIKLAIELSEMRHDVNGYLGNIVSSAELTRMRPDKAADMYKYLVNEPFRVKERIKAFSDVLEQSIGITPEVKERAKEHQKNLLAAQRAQRAQSQDGTVRPTQS